MHHTLRNFELPGAQSFSRSEGASFFELPSEVCANFAAPVQVVIDEVMRQGDCIYNSLTIAGQQVRVRETICGFVRVVTFLV